MFSQNSGYFLHRCRNKKAACPPAQEKHAAILSANRCKVK